MRKLLFCLIPVLFVLHTYAQTIQVFSLPDSLPLPGIVTGIRTTGKWQHYKSDANGFLTLTTIHSDSTYSVLIRQLGLIDYQNTLTGKQLLVLKSIYLSRRYVGLGEVVVTAQYKPIQVDQAVQKIKIISAKKIEQMGAVNLRDVLTNETNIRLTQDNILGSSMSLQGISGENVKILVDGVPLIGRLNGNIDLSQINLNNIDHIEITEGPLSVQYGTNALAGTVNLITKKNQKNTLDANTYYESAGHYNADARAAANIKQLGINAGGGRNYFDGWNSYDQPFSYVKQPLADSTRFKQWKPKEQYFGSAGLTYSFAKMQAGINTTLFQEKIINRGKPRAPYYENAFDDYYYTRRLDHAAFLSGKIARNWNLNFTAANNTFERIKTTYFKDLTTLQENSTQNSSDHDTSRFNLLLSRASFSRNKDSARINYEIGYDVSFETAAGKRIENQTRSMGDYAIFSTAEYRPISKLLVKPGLRIMHNTAYKAPLIPVLNLKYELNKKNTLRGSYARGFRAPGLKELYFFFVDINHNIIGNSELKAEQSHNFSLIYTRRFMFEKSTLLAEVSSFYNTVFNLIGLAQINAAEYAYVNIGTYKTQGVQGNVRYNYRQLELSLGGNYTGRYNSVGKQQGVKTYSYSPEANGSIAYTFKKNGINFSLFYKYNGKIPGFVVVDDQVQQTFVNAYNIADCSVSIPFFKKKMLLTAGCKNLFNVRTIQTGISTGVHASGTGNIPVATGRNFFLKLSLRL